MTNDQQPTTNDIRSRAAELWSEVVSCKLLVVSHKRKAFGFSLVELMVVIAIMLILAVMLTGLYTNFTKTQALQAETSSAASLFDRARAQSVAGVDGAPHGVHVASTTLTLFEGTSYVSGSAGNQVMTFTNSYVLASKTINGGGADVVFGQLTGITTDSAKLVFQVGSDATRQKTITISATGVVKVQ